MSFLSPRLLLLSVAPPGSLHTPSWGPLLPPCSLGAAVTSEIVLSPSVAWGVLTGAFFPRTVLWRFGHHSETAVGPPGPQGRSPLGSPANRGIQEGGYWQLWEVEVMAVTPLPRAKEGWAAARLGPLLTGALLTQVQA